MDDPKPAACRVQVEDTPTDSSSPSILSKNKGKDFFPRKVFVCLRSKPGETLLLLLSPNPLSTTLDKNKIRAQRKSFQDRDDRLIFGPMSKD